MTIRMLDNETISKIAAGEIILNPSSVVRELIDNAIDACAKDVKILVTEGGKDFIQVKDNGQGMSLSDLKIACKKHSTSKIAEFEDIYKTKSLGFRGEALHSIAVMSETQIISKVEGEDHANAIKLSYDNVIETKQVASNRGTTVNVKNLFCTTPVRKKVLKQASTEFRYIKEIFISKTIPYNNINFSLVHNDLEILSTNKSSNRLSRIEDFFGKELAQGLIYLEDHTKDYIVTGYVSNPNFFKKSKKYQFIYINGRPISSPAISVAIANAYKSITPIGSYPCIFLFIEISPECLDVNIHPSKKEVAILTKSSIYDFINHVLEISLRSSINIAPEIEFTNKGLNESLQSNKSAYTTKYEYLETKEPIQQYNKAHEPQKGFNSPKENIASAKKNYIPYKTTTQGDKKEHKKSYPSQILTGDNYTILGTLFNTYILIESDNTFIMLDQHAAHERLQYEKIRETIKEDTIPSQNLLRPFIIEVSPSHISNIKDKEKSIAKLGFHIELFSKESYIVNSIPSFLKMDSARDSIEYLLELCIDNKTVPKALNYLEEVMKRKACRSAIKSGDLISDDEIIYLLNELRNYPNPFACPHGRPTILSLDRNSLENLFLRT